MKIDDLCRFTFLSQLKTNPSRSLAALAVSQADLKKNNYRSAIWLFDGRTPRQLTACGERSHFVFEDDQTLLFTANRSDEERRRAELGIAETACYRIRCDGGEAQPAFVLPVKASRIEPLGNGRYLILAPADATDPKAHLRDAAAREAAATDRKDAGDHLVFEQIPFCANGEGFLEGTYDQLYLYHAQSGLCEAISPAGRHVTAFALDPLRTRLAAATTPLPARRPIQPDVQVCDLQQLDWQTVYSGTDLIIDEVFFWQGAIHGFATDQETCGLNQNRQLYAFSETQQTATCCLAAELDLGSSVGSDVRLGGTQDYESFEDDLKVVLTTGGQAQIFAISPSCNLRPLTNFAGSIDGFVTLNGTLIAVGLLEQDLLELYEITPAGPVRRTAFNQDLWQAGSHPARPQPLTARTKDDTELEGWVLLPPDASAHRSYPGILVIHGGPKTSYGPVFVHEMQVWASRGFFVFFCNPRGSSGRGNAFSDIRGKYGTVDYEDLMCFTDAVLKAYPMIDANRLGVTGGSYGGFMTNWIIGQTDRFKAAVSQRSISNWTSFYGTSDIGYYFALDQNTPDVIRTDPVDFMKLWQHSPLKYSHRVTTPLLILHADADYRCPVEQAYQMFTALVDRGVPSKLVVFKDENHELSRSGKPKARLERLKQITAWFERYLLPSGHD